MCFKPERPRNVTAAEKNSILAAYSIRQAQRSLQASMTTYDHWLPHWMGGSDTAKNIWFEPHAGKFGSFTKDLVEAILWLAVT
jgi:hypothetical protein